MKLLIEELGGFVMFGVLAIIIFTTMYSVYSMTMISEPMFLPVSMSVVSV